MISFSTPFTLISFKIPFETDTIEVSLVILTSKSALSVGTSLQGNQDEAKSGSLKLYTTFVLFISPNTNPIILHVWEFPHKLLPLLRYLHCLYI